MEESVAIPSPENIALYHSVAAVIAEQGPVTLSVSKTTITFKGVWRDSPSASVMPPASDLRC
jgi:hypothetical protein